MEKLLDFLLPALEESDRESAKEWKASRKAWAELVKARAKGADKRIRKARKMYASNGTLTDVQSMLARHKREADDMLDMLKPKKGRPPRWVGWDMFCRRMIRTWREAGGKVVLSKGYAFMTCPGTPTVC